MRTEFRFLIAVALMMGVLVGTNILFPPVIPDTPEVVDTTEPLEEPVSEAPSPVPEAGVAIPIPDATPDALVDPAAGDAPDAVTGGEPRRTVVVEGPLYRMSFSNYGGVAESVALTEYDSFAHDGPVELIPPEAPGILGGIWVVGPDSVDLTTYPYTVTPADGITLSPGGGPETLTFRYDHPGGRFFSEIRYTFTPDSYAVLVEGTLPALDRAALYVDLGTGLAFNELEEPDERRLMAYSGNHVQDGIRARPMTRVDEVEVMEGPLLWAAVKSKFFVEVVIPGDGSGAGGELLAGVWVEPAAEEGRASVRIGTPVANSGDYAYRAYLGPMERVRLVALGDDLQEVNPIGWRFFRPVIRPFVGVILWLIRYLHEQLLLGYGWVLIVIGVSMRVLLWPLNQKAMRAQIRNMAVQPLMQEIQKKHKENPEQLQKEMLKLYKEHGYNPLAGCLPMLLPWPMLIALFFVFQNTIQLRGVPFLWLPDLSAPDPLFVLPVFLGVSMFLLQFISLRSMETSNPQMKMMMYIMPVMMVFIFFRLPSGLNLYYATVNLATIPQQVLIAKERRKARVAGPVKSPT